ncbi:MAG: MBL fold metallo-hydrolase [Oscillospiraceae bacterium]|nr:MBL fold metallo-hydrolase [Oscillospiraceae bacterium]
MEQYQRKTILPGITLLYGFPEECCIYAAEGERALALIDTGMGKGDLPAALEALAPGKEILVFNTHCHFDHSAGNFRFPAVRMHPGCGRDQDETEAMPGAGRPCARRIPVREGDTFDLGGVTLEVIETPGHTPGCICLLDRTRRVLFAGDLIGSDVHNVWMLDHLPWVKFSTVSLECYLRSLEKVEALGDRFDGFLCGHDDRILGREYLRELMRLTRSVLEGTAKPERPDIPSPPGQDPVVCWRVRGEGVPTAILYQEESLHDKKRG